MRAPVEFAEGLALGQLYWLYGSAPQGQPPVHVMDPPCSGWGTVIVMDQAAASRRVFHSSTLKSWVLPNHCYEMLSLQAVSAGACHPGWQEELRARLVDRLRSTYAAHKLRGWSDSDYETTERVLRMLGSSAPAEDEWQRLSPASRRSDSAVTAVAAKRTEPERKTQPAAAFKPVKRAGRKGEVLAFFVEKGLTASRAEAMAKFGITSSNLLSQLFLLRKDHGIDYKASGDSIVLTLPGGVADPFQEAA